MASERRIEKIAELLKEEVSRILDREIEFSEGVLVTITRVFVSEDKRYATVFFSAFGKNSTAALEILQKNVYSIQQIVNKRLRMRPVPQIRFERDEDEERRERVEKSISDLHRKEGV